MTTKAAPPAATCPDVAEGPLYFTTPSGASINLDGWYAGRSVFLTMAGPSLSDCNLAALQQHGIVTLGVNNVWCTPGFRPRLWTCVDNPERFHDRCWRDPAITKFAPQRNADNHLRYRDEAGVFQKSRLRVRDCPSVFFFPRNASFDPATFLEQASICWGGDDKEVDHIGIKGFRNVMLVAIRLAHALGFRRVYLCGADFHMQEGAKNYSFGQERTKSTIAHNQRQYQAMSARLAALQPYLEMAGTQVWNCTPGSRLKVFPTMRLSEALEAALQDCGGPLDAAGWYDPPPKPPPPPPDPFAFLRTGGE